MKNRFIITLLFAFVALSARAQKGDEKLLKIVEELGDKMEKLVVSEDIDAIVAMYGENARYLPDGDKEYAGLTEIRQKWEQTFRVDVQAFKMTTTSVSGDKRLIYETGLGESTVSYNGQTGTLKFKFVNVWERQANGEYKLVIDIYNRVSPS